MDDREPISIKKLYPHMSEAELAVAAANLERYVALLLRISERLEAEGKTWQQRQNLA